MRFEKSCRWSQTRFRIAPAPTTHEGGATLHGIADQSFQYNVDLVQDEEWVRLRTTLTYDSVSVEALPSEDRMRLSWGLGASTRVMENRFRQFQLGIFSEDELELFNDFSPNHMS